MEQTLKFVFIWHSDNTAADVIWRVTGPLCSSTHVMSIANMRHIKALEILFNSQRKDRAEGGLYYKTFVVVDAIHKHCHFICDIS